MLRLIELFLGKPDPYASFQAYYAHKEQQARKKHGRVNEVRQEKQIVLHRALAVKR